MKLIIDLPDEAYEILTEYQVLPENIDLEYFVIHGMPFDDVKVEIQNTILEHTYEKGQIDALEKIKAEIEHKKFIALEVLGGCGYYDGLNTALEIIDKHIKENKQ